MILQVGVKALIKNDAGQYLFLRRSAAKYGGVAERLDIPGGRIHPEESLVEALAREVFEEVNLRLNKEPQLIAAQDIFVDKKELHVVRLTYLVSASGELKLSGEHTGYEWLSLDEAKHAAVDEYVLAVLDGHAGHD